LCRSASEPGFQIADASDCVFQQVQPPRVRHLNQRELELKPWLRRESNVLLGFGQD